MPLIDCFTVIFTFQSGYIQMGDYLQVTTYPIYLYIPIWLYSNQTASSIQCNLQPFTFQSGYIQISFLRFALLLYYSLHSNLVIFKLNLTLSFFAVIYLYIPIWLYSNNTWMYQRIYQIAFTFQSGYIQIKCVAIVEQVIILYIPIWLYSNNAVLKLTLLYKSFTFQSGYIQIPPTNRTDSPH